MPFYVRLMRKEDVPQVSTIDREAFPTMWPPTDFYKELTNRLAHYIVACDENKVIEESVPRAGSEKNLPLVSRLRHLFHRSQTSADRPPTEQHYVVGFAGFWVLADEAHIINFAVCRSHQRRGIGELLLIHVIHLAAEMKARNLTLEVRVSNTPAQNLYRKYGFVQVSIRRGYYTDNREDALLMSTDDIASPQFQSRFEQLEEAHTQRWGYRYDRLTLASLAVRAYMLPRDSL